MTSETVQAQIAYLESDDCRSTFQYSNKHFKINDTVTLQQVYVRNLNQPNMMMPSGIQITFTANGQAQSYAMELQPSLSPDEKIEQINNDQLFSQLLRIDKVVNEYGHFLQYRVTVLESENMQLQSIEGINEIRMSMRLMEPIEVNGKTGIVFFSLQNLDRVNYIKVVCDCIYANDTANMVNDNGTVENVTFGNNVVCLIHKNQQILQFAQPMYHQMILTSSSENMQFRIVDQNNLELSLLKVQLVLVFNHQIGVEFPRIRKAFFILKQHCTKVMFPKNVRSIVVFNVSAFNTQIDQDVPVLSLMISETKQPITLIMTNQFQQQYQFSSTVFQKLNMPTNKLHFYIRENPSGTGPINFPQIIVLALVEI